MAFKKGYTPWNKGSHIYTGGGPKKGYKHPEAVKKKISLAHIGKIGWNRDKVLSNRQNEGSPKWKGDKVGYSALHKWVKHYLGKATICSQCISTINIEWANISHEYKRDLTDWMQLCHKCHGKYDSGEFRGIVSKLFLKKKTPNGVHYSTRLI